MFGVLFFTLSLTLVCASDRRLVNQINNLREDLSYVSSDVSSLFQHFDMSNKTIWSKVLGSSMKSGEDRALEQIGDLSDKESLTAIFHHELVTLKKGFILEKKLNRRLLKRLEAAEKQNAEKDAEMKTRHSEFSDMMEKTNRLNLLLSKQAKALKKSTSDLRNELEAERQLKAQLQIDYGTMISECSELTAHIQTDYLALKDDVSKFKAGLLIDYQAMKDEFLDLKNQCQIDYGSMQDEVSVLKAKIQMDYGLMKDDILELAKNVSTITKSCDILSTNIPNDVTLQTSTLIMQERDTTTPVPALTSCKDQQTSGVYDISFENSIKSPTSVYCDADTDDGGWIVILRRQDGSVNFNTTWTEYKHGFGNLDGEFWIGNDFIHQLTKSKPMELRVDMEDKNGNKIFAKYTVFRVGSEADKYVLTVSGYSGTAGDALDGRRWGRINGMKFSTFDQDNDRHNSLNCAGYYRGGWWYNDCTNSLLTGTRSKGEMRMRWYDGDRDRDLKFAEMKIR